MQIHSIRRKHPLRRKKIVGRGGKRGTTSGRGTKGQKARAGHKIRPEIRDMIKKLPKRRGYGIHRKKLPTRVEAITLTKIDHAFSINEVISPEALMKKGLLQAKNRRRQVKIIGSIATPKPFKIKNCFVTTSVRSLIEKAGGQIVVVAPIKKDAK